MKEFIFNHYKELIILFWFLIEFVLMIISICKKNKKIAPVISAILSQLPKYILLAEKAFGKGHGDDKKDYVLQLVGSFYKFETGQDIDSSSLRLIDKAIEDILFTPQKKGVNND